MRGKGDTLGHAMRKLHLWLGLVLGGLLALLGLTGSILAFYPEIDALLHPEIQVEGSGPPDWDRALATVRSAYPEKTGPWRFEVTGKPGAIPARYYDPPERAAYAFRPMMVWLSPGGEEVLRRDYWGEYAMTFTYDLHYRLLLGKLGGEVLGWLGFALLALLLSGLWAWWPRGSWVKALRIKPHAPPQRSLRDWHKITGLLGLVFLILLTATGIMLELPEQTNVALSAIGLPVDPPPHVHRMQTATPEAPKVPPSQAISTAKSVLPQARLAWIETPAATGGAYALRMQVPEDPSFRFPHSFVWVDGASGRVLAVQDASKAAAGTVVNNWLHSLHDGSVAGIWGRSLIAICGLLPLVLFVTGWVRWRLVRKISRSRPQR
jgi:uncharacterized iron-regulated membrane protein